MGNNNQVPANVYTYDLGTFETKYNLANILYIKVTIYGVDIYYWNNPFIVDSNDHMLKLAIDNYFRLNEGAKKEDLLMLVLTNIHNIYLEVNNNNKKQNEMLMYSNILTQLAKLIYEM